MPKLKLIRITTVPVSLQKLLEGQLAYMSEFYEVIAVSSHPEELQSVAKDQGIDFFSVSFTRKITPLKDLQALWKLFKFLKKEKPTIVHSHTPKAGLLGMLAAYMAGVPIRMHTVAGLPLMEAAGFKRFLLLHLERLTYRLSTRVYPNSNGLYEFILEEKLTVPSKLKIIGKGSSNGINLNYFDPAIYSEDQKREFRESLNIQDTALVFSFIGRLVGDKGVNELIGAFIEIVKDREDIHLVLVGPLEADLDPLEKDILGAIKTHSKIHPVGYQLDVRPYLAISSLFVFPSYREGFPNAVMQALAMNVPVIASDINGCNELIVHGENGWLIPPKNIVALEQQMRSVLDQPEMLETMKVTTRASIEKDFQREIIWQLLRGEYESLIKENS